MRSYKMPFPISSATTTDRTHAITRCGTGAEHRARGGCVVRGEEGQPVRELDLGAISMRHTMRDDGIGSRQEQRSHTQLSHTLEGGLEGGEVPVTARSSAPVWGCLN